MKTADLKTGILYAVGGSISADDRAYVLDPQRQYSAWDFHSRDAVIQPNFSGKGTHVLLLVRSRWLDPNAAADEEVAKYTASHYQVDEVPLPKGWHVRKEVPANIRRTAAEQDRQEAVESALRETDRAAYVREQAAHAILRSEMNELLLLHGILPRRVEHNSVTLTHEQVYKMLGIEIEQKVA